MSAQFDRGKQLLDDAKAIAREGGVGERHDIVAALITAMATEQAAWVVRDALTAKVASTSETPGTSQPVAS